MLAVEAEGYALLSSPHAFIYYMQTNSYAQFASFTLSVIPLFTLMGALAEQSGIAATLFRAAERAFGRYRGGLPFVAADLLRLTLLLVLPSLSLWLVHVLN
ncbi:MAG TPA: TRAP transporter large permease subunit [Devosia sp.]|nr:TRAP transporter large permease subunit [Devosia sp.]